MEMVIAALGAFLVELFAVNWATLIGTAIASGAGLTVVTQLLKVRWVAVPAKKYPRAVSFVLALIVGIVGAIASGLVLSSITTLVVFTIIAFVVSGITYDAVKRLVAEIRDEESL